MRRAVLLLVLTAGCPCGTLPGDTCGPPPPDTCDHPDVGAVLTLEIGTDQEPFTAYHDLDQPHIVRGGQGATMMGLRLHLTGTVPACLMQATHYEDGAQGGDRSPVKTYQQSDGSYTTNPLWIPGSFPGYFIVQADAGGKTTQVHLGTPLDMQ